MSGKIITGVSVENDTPNKKSKEKIDKYLTLILKYKETKDTTYPSVMYVTEEIIQAIRHYNANRPYGDSNSRFELFGLYIDDDDPERQNIINQEEKNKLED